VPNYVPQTIQTQQTLPSEQNRNQITSEDVRSQSIFERQLNAAKALANLLDIIKQATANKNAASVEIQSRQVLSEDALSVQRAAEESIFEAENNLARIKKGIETSNEEINKLREKIDQLTSQREQKQL
jgi:chromosome segregation ATPase